MTKIVANRMYSNVAIAVILWTVTDSECKRVQLIENVLSVWYFAFTDIPYFSRSSSRNLYTSAERRQIFLLSLQNPKINIRGRVSLRRKTQCVRNPTHHPMGVLVIGHLGLRHIQVKLDIKLKAAINRKLTKKPLRQTPILERTKKDIFFLFCLCKYPPGDWSFCSSISDNELLGVARNAAAGSRTVSQHVRYQLCWR